MLSILSITFPIYAAIALGYVTVRRGIFRAEQMPVFGSYVLNIALPALLFNTVASRNLSELFNLTYITVFLAGGLLTIVASWLWFTFGNQSPTRRAVAIMGTTCHNSGFIGYPVMSLAFPTLAGQILALNMLVENLVLIPICLALMEAAKGEDDARLLRKTFRILLGVLRRPMVIGLAAGILVSLLELSVPSALIHFFSMLAASASALALFVIGGSLVGTKLRGNRAVAVQIAFGKLLIHPAMVVVALAIAAAFGLPPLSDNLHTAVIISAAIPMFSIYALFAQELNHEGMASIAQIVATTVAFFTLSALLYLLL